MYKVKDVPYGISLFLVFLVGLEIYWSYSFLSWGLFDCYGNSLGSLSVIKWLILLFMLIILAIVVIMIIRGFLEKDDWARKFAITILLIAILMPLWAILVGCSIIEQFILFLIYIVLIIYLMTSYVKKYFVKVFRYGEWTLYKRVVTLKSGKTLTIYFFSKHIPHSGEPTVMPEGYTVGINERSNMPYLKKIGTPDAYSYGKWKLYKKQVKLKSGKVLTIYFFSGKKPKSGKRCSMPEGYEVGINPRSNMPFLRKKSTKPKTGNVEVWTSEEKKEDEESKAKKAANVIYVVSKPQPGEVRGDWAVRSHGKIYSHHKTKRTAIREARKIAKQRDATVMIQKTDGTFSMGFHPKKNK